MQIYFVRHGESEANVQKIIPGGGELPGLTQNGIRQVYALAQQISAVNRIFSSPIARAAQSAEILATHFELGYEIADALHEFDCGVLKGKPDKAVYAIWDDWMLRGNWSHRFDQGESFEDIKARFLPFIESLTQKHHDETVLLVGHGGTFRAMLPLVLENIDFAFAYQNWIPNAGYVHAESKGESLFCRQWGDISFSQKI
jgi:broad specificity phosphatase PhoE